jgi:hypothetical protein
VSDDDAKGNGRCALQDGAGIAFGVVLFLDLLPLVILEIQWIIYWSRKLKSEKAKQT